MFERIFQRRRVSRILIVALFVLAALPCLCPSLVSAAHTCCGEELGNASRISSASNHCCEHVAQTIIANGISSEQSSFSVVALPVFQRDVPLEASLHQALSLTTGPPGSGQKRYLVFRSIRS